MTVEQILTPLINQELQKYQTPGRKLKLKTAAALRKKYVIGCLIGAIFFWPVALIVLCVLLAKITPVKVILEAAKKQPDTPIAQIVAQEVIW